MDLRVEIKTKAKFFMFLLSVHHQLKLYGRLRQLKQSCLHFEFKLY